MHLFKVSQLATRVKFLRTFCAKSDDFYDVIVVGNGLVGASFASALKQEACFKDMRLLVLEHGSKLDSNWQPGKAFNNRVCAINNATIDLFTKIGAWEVIQDKFRYRSVYDMKVWDACSSTSKLSFSSEDSGNMNDPIAYIIENDVMLRVFQDQQKDVPVRYGAKVLKFKEPSLDNRWVEVELECGEKLRTRLLVGADGFNSKVRRDMGIHTFKWDYKQSAVVATLSFEQQSDNYTAWQRFLPSGPVALLPLDNTHSSLIWTTSPKEARDLCSMSEEEFVDSLNIVLTDCSSQSSMTRFVENVGVFKPHDFEPPVVTKVENRANFPLSLVNATQYVKPRVALIGDAAHRLHPLAGQGVNLGFADVVYLSEALKKANSLGSDLGNFDHLSEYQRQSQLNALPVMMTIHGLNYLYNNDFLPVVLLRSLGLSLTDSMPFVKNFLRQQANHLFRPEQFFSSFSWPNPYEELKASFAKIKI